MKHDDEKSRLEGALERFPSLAAALKKAESAVAASDDDSEEPYRMPYSSRPIRSGSKWKMNKMLDGQA